MKIAIFTTQTLHHTYFVQRLAERGYELAVFCQDGGIVPPFEIYHPFEKDRDQYERENWFAGNDLIIEDFAPTIHVSDINSDSAVKALSKFDAEIAIVFGTSRLSSNLIQAGPKYFLNLHGGHPEYYRGLDTHLWAIYHGDYRALTTTIHHLNTALDDGDICLQEDIHIWKGMKIYQLRKSNTETCVRLALAAINAYEKIGTILSRAQLRKGRYYSFMPSVLKEVCLKKFELYANEKLK